MTCHVEDNERLSAMQVAVWLNIGITKFQSEVESGLWDGTYIVTGNQKEFIAHYVKARQDELVARLAANLQRKAA